MTHFASFPTLGKLFFLCYKMTTKLYWSNLTVKLILQHNMSFASNKWSSWMETIVAQIKKSVGNLHCQLPKVLYQKGVKFQEIERWHRNQQGRHQFLEMRIIHENLSFNSINTYTHNIVYSYKTKTQKYFIILAIF